MTIACTALTCTCAYTALDNYLYTFEEVIYTKDDKISNTTHKQIHVLNLI